MILSGTIGGGAWSGARELVNTLASDPEVWESTPVHLRADLRALLNRWCEYVTTKDAARPGTSAAFARAIAGLAERKGLSLVVPELSALDKESRGLLEALLECMGGRLCLVVGCRRMSEASGLLTAANKVHGTTVRSAVTMTSDALMGRRIWFNASPESFDFTWDEVYSYDAAA
jgi:hypothetical protein